MSYLQKKGVYLTGKRIAVLFREAALMIYPNMTKDELLWFSTDSLRVWEFVLLDKAGMSPEFIMSRLRWMGNLFQIYLRYTGMIQDKHRDILQAASQEVLDLIAGPHWSAPTIRCTDLSTVNADNTMGDYAYEMD